MDLIIKKMHKCKDSFNLFRNEQFYFLLFQGGNTIRQLLKIAKKTVPEEEWRRTPVVLRATAGLRLLPQEKANALLQEVRPISTLASDSPA